MSDIITLTELLTIIENNIKINQDVKYSLTNLEIFIKELPVKLQDEKYKEALQQIDEIREHIKLYENEGSLKIKIDQIPTIKEKLIALDTLNEIKLKVENTHNWTTYKLPSLIGIFTVVLNGIIFLILNMNMADKLKPLLELMQKLAK